MTGSQRVTLFFALLLAIVAIVPLATAQEEPFVQTDLTISSVLLPDTTSPGAEFGSQTRVTVYNQGTTVIEAGFTVEMVISSDRLAPIELATPTTTFIEDGLMPNGKVVMPRMDPEGTFTFTIPGMTMVTDAPLDKLIFVCAVVDPENSIDEEWRIFPLGIGVNKLCMPIDIVPGSGFPTPVQPIPEPPVVEPPTSTPPPPTRVVTSNNSLADYDGDENCVLGDAEFFDVVDDWTSESTTNTLFFNAIDAWMGERDICEAVSQSRDIRMLQHATGITWISQGNQLLDVKVIDLHGRVLFEKRAQSKQLHWNLRDQNNRPVANGVYFVKMSSTNELRKIVVVR